MSNVKGSRTLLFAAALAAAAATASADNIVAGQGPEQANPNRVRVFRADGTPTATNFVAYSYGWGVTVAAGDVEAGGQIEIVVGAGPGPSVGPHVRAFRRDGTSIGKINFFAYGLLRGGVNVASGRIDAADEMVTGPGPLDVFSPHVRGWSYGGAVQPMSQVSYFAYPGLVYGVNVATAGIDADAFHEILTGPGSAGSNPTIVRCWNYDGVGITTVPNSNFLAFGGRVGGVKVAGGDVNGDGDDEILAGSGSLVAGFDYEGIISTLPGCTGNGRGIGAGAVGGPAGDELLMGDASSSLVRAYAYTGSGTTLVVSFTAFGASPKVNLTGANLGL